MQTEVARTELRPLSSGPLADLFRRVFSRGAARARVIAPREVHLGGLLEVDWWLFWSDAPEATMVTVTLVGSEVAHRRISARTGISIVTETRPFLTLELDRHAAQSGWPVASGHVETRVPARTVPTLAGKLNEIAWAVMVDATSGTESLVRQTFPLAVLPVVR
jgi:hypothetical protein